jgi:hypothetical protein
VHKVVARDHQGGHASDTETQKKHPACGELQLGFNAAKKLFPPRGKF